MFSKLLFFCAFLILISCNTEQGKLSVSDIKEVAVKHFREKGFHAIKDTNHIHVKRIQTGLEDEWFVAFNAVMSKPTLFLYHISDPNEAPHYIPLNNKSEGIIKHVDFENVTNDDDYELVIELHFDYGLAYQAREIIILRNPFGNPAYEIFSFPFEQVWESIDSFDTRYGLPKHSKRIENHSFYEFFESYILIRGTINYRENHLLEYKWNASNEEFLLILDEELHEAEEETNKGGIVHKVKGTKILVEVNAHEEGCLAYLLEDVQGHILDIPKVIHDELLCSQVTSLSANGRYLIYTNLKQNALCLYDIEGKKDRPILKDFDSYEGISEITWPPKNSSRFGFISTNHEEFLENTRIHIFSLRDDAEFHEQAYNQKVYYICDATGLCVPQKDYNYQFKTANLFVYTPDSTGVFKGLKVQ
ncbi:MAG: hypothetical protein ACI976_003010 [Aureispira sp.]|jgi:hypothetical protein